MFLTLSAAMPVYHATNLPTMPPNSMPAMPRDANTSPPREIVTIGWRKSMRLPSAKCDQCTESWPDAGPASSAAGVLKVERRRWTIAPDSV